ncbi:MAG: hypothetical protein JRD89_10750 [Deltaproteobacteria bacterium]|nr:hypothetical protein [Deltaproteobacteria bacterium]
MTTSIPVGGLRATPALRRVSAQPTVNTTIQLASTVLVTLPALHAVRNPVILIASVYLLTNDDSRLDFQLFRDGAEVSAFYRFRFREEITSAAGTRLLSMHWYDDEPGVTPVYSLRAFVNAFVAGNVATTNSRFTAFI